jgi:hypothetical protein
MAATALILSFSRILPWKYLLCALGGLFVLGLFFGIVLNSKGKAEIRLKIFCPSSRFCSALHFLLLRLRSST